MENEFVNGENYIVHKLELAYEECDNDGVFDSQQFAVKVLHIIAEIKVQEEKDDEPNAV